MGDAGGAAAFKRYVKKVNVAYIGLGSFKRSMYRYHNNTLSALIVNTPNDTAYQKIQWTVKSNNKKYKYVKNVTTFNTKILSQRVKKH